MLIDEIKRLIQSMYQTYQPMDVATTISDRAMLGHVQWVLNKLDKILEEPEPIAEFEIFLKIHWTLVNGSSLSPTALPGADVTTLLCRVAECVAHEKNKGLAEGESSILPIKMLMPTISIESIRENYHLDDPLQTILNTHVLGQLGLYLLPIKLLTELDLSAEQLTLYNPYFEYHRDDHQGLCEVNAEQYERLSGHSSLTQALVDAKNNYELLASDTTHLLGQLKRLCQALLHNASTAMGEEDNAGGGAYPAIIHFMEYYNTLDHAEKERVPEMLKAEIDTLFALVTDHSLNINATANLETCIATRRMMLITHMTGHDELLSQIAVSASQKSLLMAEVSRSFHMAKDALVSALALNAYADGRDTLPLRPELLSNLDVEFSISSDDDLSTFIALSADEMGLFLKSESLRQQIVQQIQTVEQLVFFVLGLSQEKLIVFLKSTIEELETTVIRSGMELGQLLVILDVETTVVLCEAIKDKLPTLICSIGDFESNHQDDEEYESDEVVMRVFELLSLAQCKVLCHAMSGQWMSIINTGFRFNYILQRLDLEKSLAICDSMKDSWPEIIKTVHDYLELVKDLDIRSSAHIDHAMKSRLPGMINAFDDFSKPMSILAMKQRVVFFEAVKDRLPAIIVSVELFVKTLCLLNEEQNYRFIFEIMREKFPDYIQSVASLVAILEVLAPALRIHVCDAMGDKLFLLINSSIDWFLIKQLLSPDYVERLSLSNSPFFTALQYPQPLIRVPMVPRVLFSDSKSPDGSKKRDCESDEEDESRTSKSFRN